MIGVHFVKAAVRLWS